MLDFNPNPSTIMHIDLNSCFATVEQQANPLLRGKPLVVAAYASANGCILAASIEAKADPYQIKTGMRVKDAKAICPGLIVLPPDPWKYRVVHLRLRKIFKTYTNRFFPKSIDEFVLHLDGYPALKSGMWNVAEEIRSRIYQEVGDWLHVSIGIAPNRFLAKTASGMIKPRGLVEINKENYLEQFKKLKLQDLCGIAKQNEIRLHAMNIYSVTDLYKAPIWQNKAAFHSIAGYYWYVRLRGYEIDDVTFARRSYGNSYSLPVGFSTPTELSPILAKLVEKTSFRLRRAGFGATGVHLAIRYRNGNFWHKGESLPRVIFDSRDIYKQMYRLLSLSPIHAPVLNLAISCFGLEKLENLQLNLFEDVVKKKQLSSSLDNINNRWGDFVVTSARMIETDHYVPDRIAFGNVKELEEFTNSTNSFQV